jgi:uncharacterized protein (TIGR03083 family)
MRSLEDQRSDIVTASAKLADLAEANPDVPVPATPDFTLGGLANHLAAVQRWATEIVAEQRDARPERDESGPADASAAQRLREATAALDQALSEADPDAPCWSFGPDRNARFWHRRQAQEATVHLHDACAALGEESVIDPEVAVEGVTEYLDSFVAKWWRHGDWDGDGETCHLHATDAEGEWLITLTPEGPRLEFGHHKGDVALRGRAQDLLLLVWNRASADSLQSFGDDADVEGWLGRLTSMSV